MEKHVTTPTDICLRFELENMTVCGRASSEGYVTFLMKNVTCEECREQGYDAHCVWLANRIEDAITAHMEVGGTILKDAIDRLVNRTDDFAVLEQIQANDRAYYEAQLKLDVLRLEQRLGERN